MNEPYNPGSLSTTDLKLDLAEVIHRIGTLPSLPAVILELIQSLSDDNVDSHLLAKKIASDQALVAKMLRVANSSFYGLQFKVASIPDVIVVLGLRSVRTLAMATAVTGSFTNHHPVPGFDFNAFWRHSLGTALCAKALAKRLKASEEIAFTAGLLHDIGRLVLASCFPGHLAAVLVYGTEHDCLLQQAERAVIGIDHAMIGEALTRYWKFPRLIQEAVARHHALEENAHTQISGIIHVANAIAHALEFGEGQCDLVPSLSDTVWQSLLLDEIDFQAIFSDVETQFDGACEMLGA